MVTGIEHTAIASLNPEELAKWYVEFLGFKIAYRPANSRTVFIGVADGAMIEIIEATGSAAAPAPMTAAGFRHLALEVADFPAACRDLQERGIEFLSEPVKVNGNSTTFFRDPEGNILQLLHRETPLG